MPIKQHRITLEIEDIDRQILVLNRRKDELEAQLMQLNKTSVRHELNIVDGARLAPTEAFAQFLHDRGWEADRIVAFVNRGLSFEASGELTWAIVKSGGAFGVHSVPLHIIRNMRDLWVANHPSADRVTLGD